MDRITRTRRFPRGHDLTTGSADLVALNAWRAAAPEGEVRWVGWGDVEAPTDEQYTTYLVDVQGAKTGGLQGETSTVIMDDLEAGGILALSAVQTENARAAGSFAVGLAGERAASMWTILCDALASLAAADAEVQAAETVEDAGAVVLVVPKATGGAAAAPPALHMAPRFDEQATDAGIVIQPEAPPVPTDSSTARHIVTGLAIGATTLAALALVVLTAVATLAVVTVAASVGAALTYAPILLQLMAMGAL